MINGRKVIGLAVLVLVGLPELGLGQFQQQMFGPRPSGGGRGRRTSAITSGPIRLASSCLEYGVKTPEPTDVFAAVTPGRAFLVGRGPGGRVEKLDLSEAVRNGAAVIRGTGKGDQIVLEVRAPGWSELEILPGCVALPNLAARPVEVPEASLALVAKAAEAENEAVKALPAGEALIERVLGQARQEHLWAVRSNSWQALNASVDPLSAAIAGVKVLAGDPTAAARLAWVARGKDAGPTAKADRAFLGDFAVLRLAEAERGPAGIEVCRAEGVKRVPLTRAGVQRLAEAIKDQRAGDILVTEELLAALEKAVLTHTLDETLAAAGHTFAAYVRDDDLAVQPFAAGESARRRFAVIAPVTAAEAKVIFGRNNRSAFAFKGLIEEKLVERVRTAEDLKKLAGSVKADERLVLVCTEQYGRIPLLDGSEISPAELPAGVSELIACDALDAKEVAPVQPMRAGMLTFEALAAGIRSATSVAAVGPMTRAELVEALSAGIQGEWKRVKAPVGPVLKWSRKANADVVAVGSGGSLLKVGSVAVEKDKQKSGR